jgi:hypothetical protein
MLLPNLLPKVVPHGPRLLPDRIVRTRGGLVAGTPSLLCAQEARPSGSALRERGHHPGHPRAVASLLQPARLLALRFGAPTSRTCAPRVSSTAGCEPWSSSCALCSGPSPGRSPSLRPSTGSWTRPWCRPWSGWGPAKLERHRAKTLAGLLARLAAKVTAYTCGQRINDSLGRPLRHLAGLLV